MKTSAVLSKLANPKWIFVLVLLLASLTANVWLSQKLMVTQTPKSEVAVEVSPSISKPITPTEPSAAAVVRSPKELLKEYYRERMVINSALNRSAGVPVNSSKEDVGPIIREQLERAQRVMELMPASEGSQNLEIRQVP